MKMQQPPYSFQILQFVRSLRSRFVSPALPAAADQLDRREAKQRRCDRHDIADCPDRALRSDQQIVHGVKCNGRAQQSDRSRDPQPGGFPDVGNPAGDQRAADHMHGPGAEAAEQQEIQLSRAVLHEPADIFKRCEAHRDDNDGDLRMSALRLEYQQIKQQRQQLDDLLHHRRDLRRGGHHVRTVDLREKAVDVRRQKAGRHSGKNEQEVRPPAAVYKKHPDQNRSGHAGVNMVDVGHFPTALSVARRSRTVDAVSVKSNQK